MSRSFILSMSTTNHFIAFVAWFGFQVLPVITVLSIIILCVKHPDNVKDGKPPFGPRLVPDSTHFAVVKESYRYFLYLVHVLIISWHTTGTPILSLQFERSKTPPYILHLKLMCHIQSQIWLNNYYHNSTKTTKNHHPSAHASDTIYMITVF